MIHQDFGRKYASPSSDNVCAMPRRSPRLSPSPPPPPQKSETDAPLRRSSSSSPYILRSHSRNDSSVEFQQVPLTSRSSRYNRPQSRQSGSNSIGLIPFNPIPSPSSSPSAYPAPSPSPIPRLDEEKERLPSLNATDAFASPSVSDVSAHASDDHDPASSSPRFYALPRLFEQIPMPARDLFIAKIKPILTQYTYYHKEQKRRECDKLIHQLLNVPRVLLQMGNRRRFRRIDAADRLIYRLQHYNHRDEPIPSNRRPSEERKRVIDEDAKIVRLAVSLVKMGDRKRAIQVLTNNNKIAPINQENLEALRELHPAQSNPLPSPPSRSPSVIVDHCALGRIIRKKMNNGAAGGPSGWTGKHLQPLATDTECMIGLAAIVQDICNGVIVDKILRNRLLACRLTPFQKPNGGLRPVSIGEVFCKLASCYLISVSLNHDSYRSLFPSIQEGVGIADGCEKVIHFVRAARKAMGNDSIVITVDFKNAYNMRKRIDMWNALLKHRSVRRGSCVDLSRLVRYFHWAYSVASPLVLPVMTSDRRSNHLITLQSCEGVRQGANESSLLFSLSMQEIYEKALEGFPVGSVQAKAIQDDFTIIGKPEIAVEVFDRLIKLAADHGMEVQSSKCSYLPPQNARYDSMEAISAIDKLSELGVKETQLLHLLGATIGHDEDIDQVNAAVQEWAENVTMVEIERFFKLLTHRDMPVQIAFRLLMQSGLPRLAYLCRTMPPSVLQLTTHKFDQLLIETACKLFDVNLNILYRDQLWERVNGQMQLKMKNGGLGITPFVDISPSAYISSLANATPAILTLFNEIGQDKQCVKSTKQKYETLYKRIRESIHSIADVPSITTLLPPSKEQFDNTFATSINRRRPRITHPSPALYESTASVTHLQSKLSAAIEKKRVEKYQALLVNKEDKARLLSASQPSASIWLTTYPEENALQLTDDQFLAAIRHRLSISSQTQPKCCRCNPAAGPINDSQHPHTCIQLKKKETNNRHELIVYTLRDLCRLSGFLTSLHYDLRRDANEAEIVPDLYVTCAQTTFMVDVRVTYPAASTYIRTSRSDIHPLAAAANGEKEKVKKYRSLAEKNGMVFIPFVIESFGAIGRKAKEFISFITKSTDEPNQFYAYYLRRLSIALQRGNASMQMLGMSRLMISINGINTDLHQQVPQNVIIPPLPALVEEENDEDRDDENARDEVSEEKKVFEAFYVDNELGFELKTPSPLPITPIIVNIDQSSPPPQLSIDQYPAAPSNASLAVLAPPPDLIGNLNFPHRPIPLPPIIPSTSSSFVSSNLLLGVPMNS